MVIMELALTMSLMCVLWKYNKPFSLFLGMATLSMFYPHYGPMSLDAHRMIFIGLLWYFFLVHFEIDSGHLLDALCYGALINLAVQYLQVLQPVLKFEFWLGCPVPVGLMANPNETSALYVFCFPAFIRFGWKWGAPLIISGLILSNSHMGIACVSIGFVIWLLSRHNAYYTAISILLFAGLSVWIIFYPPQTLAMRAAVWGVTYQILKQHWFMGAGIGHWKVLFKGPMPIDGSKWVTAHNEYYQVWAEMGVIPLTLIILYFSWLIRLFVGCRKSQEWNGNRYVFISIGMIAINATGNFCFHIAPLAMIALTWMAILEANLNAAKQKTCIRF